MLRYWEGEFPILAPAKNRAGNRIYTEKDISKILEIKRLLYDEKFTIEGARQHFKNNQGTDRKAGSGGPKGTVPAEIIIEKDLARKALLDVQEAVADLIEIIRKER